MTSAELARQFNRTTKPGAQVIYAGIVQTTTTSPAFVNAEGEAVIKVNGFGIVPLIDLRVTE